MKFATTGFKTEDGVISAKAKNNKDGGVDFSKKKVYVRKPFVLKGTIAEVQAQLHEMIIREKCKL